MAIVINGSTGISATESSSVLGDGAVEAADLASGAAVSNIGYTPANQANVMGRNLIINGDMRISQRGTSFGPTSTGQYTLDRWEYNPSGATSTITQESFSPGTEVAGCKNFLKMSVSSGNNNGGMIYKVEDVQSLRSNESFTLSFYAKGTNPTAGATRVRIRQYFGSGGSATVTVYESTITLTSSWQRFIITDTFDDLTGKTIGTGSYIDITIDQPDSDTGTSAWELNLTGVQLEVGSVATEFERRPYGTELALCQRYYWQNSGRTTALSNLANGANGTFIMYQQAMRAAPTLSSPSTTNFTASNIRDNCCWVQASTTTYLEQLFINAEL